MVIKMSNTIQERLDAICEICAWFIKVLMIGQTPLRDWSSQGETAEGWRGVMCQVRGDWAF